jgi:hypothetical protein
VNEYSSLDPTKNPYNITSDDIINNDTTIVTSNCSSQDQFHNHLCTRPCKWAAAACVLLGLTSHEALNALTIATLHAIVDTGATSIFIMDGVNVVNKLTTLKPLTINLPDDKKVRSTHVCNIAIPGLPIILTGHIVPDLALALLIGIHLLCKAGCRVIFDNHKCEVEYKGNFILRGYKDPSTNLWMLPITPDGMQSALS